ncbi:SDR family NAD(P)-dependent oxidoreductase [soil metagenome]
MPTYSTHKGRVAVVTGAGRGIGASIATELAHRGAHVVVADLDFPFDTVAEISDHALGVAADVSDPSGWADIARAAEDFGEVDIVINNAAYYTHHHIDDLDLQTWRRTMAVNVDAHYLSAKQFLPAMRRKKWGRFVGISSNSVGLAVPGISHYIASKMAVIGFMRGLANDVANDGITCNVVLPGLTHTPATDTQSDEERRTVWQSQAIKRLAEPEDILGPIMFLTSEDAAFITAQAIVADGGQYRIG